MKFAFLFFPIILLYSIRLNSQSLNIFHKNKEHYNVDLGLYTKLLSGYKENCSSDYISTDLNEYANDWKVLFKAKAWDKVISITSMSIIPEKDSSTDYYSGIVIEGYHFQDSLSAKSAFNSVCKYKENHSVIDKNWLVPYSFSFIMNKNIIYVLISSGYDPKGVKYTETLNKIISSSDQQTHIDFFNWNSLEK